MRAFVKRKLKGTAASEHYVPVGSADTVEDDHTGNAVLVHTTCYKMLQKVKKEVSMVKRQRERLVAVRSI